MFFWMNKIFHVHISSFKASLQSCHKKINPNKSDIENNPKRIKSTKRTFSFTPSVYRASMCLESSLSFSFFLLFLVNIFSIIFLFMTYTEDLCMLHQQGKSAAMYSYLTAGEEGIFEEDICLQKNRVMTSPFPILPIPKCRLYTKCVVKPWTGYDIIREKEEKTQEAMVYMTDYGKVYHKSRSCSYLELSIEVAAVQNIGEKRNQLGECYYPCELCTNEGFMTVVYITSYGNRYHLTTTCQGIKRSINRVPFSEVKGVKPCERCG